MKLVIAGSRVFNNMEKVKELIEVAVSAMNKPVTTVLCGCAQGVDIAGAEWATERGIKVDYYPADWKKYGKAAGPIRNKKMAVDSDEVLVIRAKISPGSENMVEKTLESGKVLHEYVITGKDAATLTVLVPQLKSQPGDPK